MPKPFLIAVEPTFLVAQFAEPQRMLSWSINKPGFRTASRVVWLEVRNADLPLDLDPLQLVADRLATIDQRDAVAVVTSRSIARHHYATACVEGVTATCLATVGLSNGERVGARRSEALFFGTINILLHVNEVLSPGAFVEVVSLVAMARTAAVLDCDIRRSGVAITGTGIDCIVVAAPVQGEERQYAGMHTAIGEAIGASVYEAILNGVETWRFEFEAPLAATSSAAPDLP